jgi:hypothetical protein
MATKLVAVKFLIKGGLDSITLIRDVPFSLKLKGISAITIMVTFRSLAILTA